MTDQQDGSEFPGRRIVIRPNQALSSWRLAELYAVGMVFSMVIAAILAWLGYWPILVFAVLEWIAIGVCVWMLKRAGRYREVLTITMDTITVRKGYSTHFESTDFQRHWASVEREEGRSWYPSRLVIRSHGTECEIGQCLVEDERRTLKAKLDQLIGPVNRTPDMESLK